MIYSLKCIIYTSKNKTNDPTSSNSHLSATLNTVIHSLKKGDSVVKEFPEGYFY